MRILALLLVLVAFACAPAFAIDQELKDARGTRIGTIKSEGNRDCIYDARGTRLGWFDGRYTYDARGTRIGEGNLLTTLLR
ncbi:MAG: hypothetical protein IJR11_00235 [Synergistaceae bacterium]|nr:hypothetical protein [Synergistaceae bacterium]